MTKPKTDKPIPKNQRSKRTSLWLDNGLRKSLDQRCRVEGRSLANAIEFYLRKGLGKPAKGEADASATIFG